MTLPRFQPRIPSRTSGSTAVSAVFPGHTQTRTGMPSLVTANPMITCGRSER